MDRNLQSTLIKQAATMATLATQVNSDVDMKHTINNLRGYETSLSLVKDEELAPFGMMAKVLVTATIKYLLTRDPLDRVKAIKHSEHLGSMMTAYLGGGK